MIWTNAVLEGSTVAVLALLLAAGTAEQDRQTLDVSLRSAPSEAFTRTIAALGEPDLVRLDEGETFLSHVEARCGQVDPTWVRIFLETNPGVSPTDLETLQGRELSMPACARPPTSAPVEVAFGDRLERFFTERGESFASAQFAAVASDASIDEMRRLQLLNDVLTYQRSLAGFQAIDNAVRFAAANPGVDPGALRPGTDIVLPQSPVWSELRLRAGVNLETAAAQLRSSGGGRVDVEPTVRAELVHEVDAGDGRCAAGQARWPFDPAVLREAMSRNANLRGADTEVPVTEVLILDTGIDGDFLAQVVPPILQGRLRPFGAASGGARHLGVNLAQRNHDFTPPPDLANRSHGGEVTSALLGSRWLPDGDTLLAGKIKVTFANVATSDRPSLLSARAIANVLAEARRNEIDVVNVSLSASEEREAFMNALAGGLGDQLVFVAAAGNDGRPFSTTNFLWLGGWGGGTDIDTVIITVGAHDQDGRILGFSRRGDQSVDLLAPGCAIPVLSGGPASGSYEIRELHRAGTSYAAPQVSLVSALLRAEELSPRAVKARLIQSVDFDPALANTVWSAGRLNLGRALSVYEDQLSWRRGGQVSEARGSLTNLHAVAVLCGQEVRVSELRKVARANHGATVRLLVWTAGSDASNAEAMTKRLCEATPDDELELRFDSNRPGEIIVVELNELIDFTPRTLPEA